MSVLKIRPCRGVDLRKRYVAEGPIDFETWLSTSLAADRTVPDTELVRGVMIDRMSAQYPHEWIFAWLFTVLRAYVVHQKLGVVLGSRTAVKISGNDGRLPDLLFVRSDNMDIIRKDAIYGVPDLVIELVSENDRQDHLVTLEADYRSIGVTEIVLIDPQRQRIRYLRRRDSGAPTHTSLSNDPTDKAYYEMVLVDGRLELATVQGFGIEIAWLFADDKPDELTLANQLVSAATITR